MRFPAFATGWGDVPWGMIVTNEVVGAGSAVGRYCRRWVAVLVVAVAALSTACADRTGFDASLEPMVRDSAGVTILEFPAAVLESEAHFRLSEEPEVRLGVMEGDEALQFSTVRDALRTPEGEIVVLDARGAPVRRFGPDGALLGTFGALGGGPGEFGVPASISLGPEGTLTVWDSRTRRFSEFEPTGELVREWAPLREMMSVQILATLPTGPNEAAAIVEGFPSGVTDGLHQPPASVVRASGGPADTLSTLVGSTIVLHSEAGSGGTLMVAMQRPWYHPQLLAASAREGFWTAEGVRWEAEHRSLEGAVDRVIRVQSEPRPFDQGVRNRLLESSLEGATSEDQRQSIRTTHRDREYPELLPSVIDLFIDAEDRVWLGALDLVPRNHPSGVGTTAERWLIVDLARERAEGMLQTPPRSRPLYADAEGVLLLTLDEFDVPYVEWRPFVETPADG